ncbi:hypothetical protein M0802_012180 [Mischocyttarus mexicanus]|nr:hypothetical protein M0802_012180 [Mischocyttarus mexicanus]
MKEREREYDRCRILQLNAYVIGSSQSAREDECSSGYVQLWIWIRCIGYKDRVHLIIIGRGSRMGNREIKLTAYTDDSVLISKDEDTAQKPRPYEPSQIKHCLTSNATMTLRVNATFRI